MEHTPPTAVIVSDVGNGERLQDLLDDRVERVLHVRTFRAAIDLLMTDLRPTVVLLDRSMFSVEEDRDAALASLQLIAGDVVVEINSATRPTRGRVGRGRSRQISAS